MRALLLLANSACTFAALRHLPLPVTTSLAMLVPLISTLLAALVLKDHVPRSKWAMVRIGFIGMLLVVRPGGSQFIWTVVYPIGSAITFACFQVVSSHLSRLDDAITTNFLTDFVATIVLSVLVWIDQTETLPAIASVRFGSWLLFGQVPDMWMAIGICVIAASGIGTVLMHGRRPTKVETIVQLIE